MTVRTDNYPKFGNMRGGSGLHAVFDSNSTTGYFQGTHGWAGVDLGEPIRVLSASLLSASNGFDASGLETQVTLELRAANTMPQQMSDGVLLGTKSFTDQNTARVVTIDSTDTDTKFEYIWFVIKTGVWAVAGGAVIHENIDRPAPKIPPVEVYTIEAERTSFQRSINQKTPMTWVPSKIDDFDIGFKTRSSAVATLHFRSDVIHNNIVSGVIGISARIFVQEGDTEAECLANTPTKIPNAVSGQNIYNITDHYGNINIHKKIKLEANKYYLFTVQGSAHTTLSSQNGLCSILAEYGDGLNNFMISVDETEVLAEE